MSLQASQLRTLARCALAAATRHQAGTLSPHAAAILAAWCDALPLMQKELGESFHGSLHDLVTRRAVGMLHRESTARDEVVEELQSLLATDDDLKNQLASGEWHDAAWTLAGTAIRAYHAALVKGQS